MQKITIDDFKKNQIQVIEPFSDFLMGSDEEKRFTLSLLDVVRFAGHACPSMVGAFLISQRAVKELFPDGVCVRGDVAIDIPSGPTQGATGPIANVFGFIFGAWADTGFGGLSGQFARRNLVRFNVSDVAPGSYRFKNLKTGKSIDIFYNPNLAPFTADPDMSFQQQWRYKIKSIVENQNAVIQSR